ncbi:bursicon-like [Sycon ciliatum]|uniref:bursicon-like n=1 Tax=Sycon ciliatum TaxID=27933 RepID=UPI0020A8F28B
MAMALWRDTRIRAACTTALLSVIALLLMEDAQGMAPSAAHICQPAPYNLELKHEGCESRIQPTDTCKGLCTSHSEPDLTGNGQMVEHCKCCIPKTMESANVTLNCPGREPVVMRVPRATKCKCRPCDKRPE